MTHQSLLCRSISVPMRLGLVNDPAHFLFLLLCQFNIPRSPVLLETVDLGRAGDRDHSLCSNPSERDLANRAALSGSKFFDLFDDCFVFVEVFTLEFRGYSTNVSVTLRQTRYWNKRTSLTEIIRCKVLGRIAKVAVIDEPSMS